MALKMPTRPAPRPEPVTFPLTHADRCDRCGARALVRVLLGFSVLDFCKHHYEQNAAVLGLQDFTVDQDLRGEWLQ